ncbi:MAG: NosD domain-containing protein [Candidatus Bathyarchaeota archaeon]|nr:NosD domain-containing protein [Candidatus Bathyarchaeum tardum]
MLKLKLVTSAILAILLVSLILGTSCYFIPNQEIPPSKLSQVVFTVHISVDLSRIYIESDGTICPADAPLARSGDFYFFTDDIINNTIEIQKDDIILDGAQHSLRGRIEPCEVIGEEAIYFSNVSNITIQNINIEQFSKGIVVQNCSNILIKNNKMHDIRSTAIDMDSSYLVGIIGNSICNVSEAIKIDDPNGNVQALNYTISENKFELCISGIQIFSGKYASITTNYFSNVVNPITVASNLTLIARNTLVYGINGIAIGGKYFGMNGNGSGGSDCLIIGNKIENFTESGIRFNIGINNIVYGNIIIDNKYGIALNLGGDVLGSWKVENNTIYQNNFINNMHDVFIGVPDCKNDWDNGEKGNYWSNFKGSDVNNDGISEISYVISNGNIDRYPLMKPIEDLTEQSLSGHFFALFLGLGVILSLLIMLGITFYFKNKQGKTIVHL